LFSYSSRPHVNLHISQPFPVSRDDFCEIHIPLLIILGGDFQMKLLNMDSDPENQLTGMVY